MDSETLKRRIHSIDLLRGVVMMIMLIDHVREFVHAGALQSDPTNPDTTTAAVFFTRWITHFCAPTFVFLSGVSIYLQKEGGKTKSELSWFLVTRGLWLIFLEFTIIRFSLVFNLDYTFFGIAQVIWVIGASMIAMATFLYLPVKLVGAIGVLMIVLHNLFDGLQVPIATAFGGTPPPDLSQMLWMIIHQPGIVPLFGGMSAFFAYPLLPWVGVMMAGYALGQVYSIDGERRRKMLFALGSAAILLFVILRAVNVYGEPVAWSSKASGFQTFLSFLNTTKYPPSLLFLLMTLGPSIVLLALTDRIDGKALWQRIPIVFGRVPMFYYIPHLFLAHGTGVLLSWLAGKDSSYLFLNLLEMGQAAPPGHGFPLWVVYAVCVAILVILYPFCKWYGDLKQRNKHWLFSYI